MNVAEQAAYLFVFVGVIVAVITASLGAFRFILPLDISIAVGFELLYSTVYSFALSVVEPAVTVRVGISVPLSPS